MLYPRPTEVNGAGDEFFACTAFARNQDADRTCHLKPIHVVENLLHRLASGDKPLDSPPLRFTFGNQGKSLVRPVTSLLRLLAVGDLLLQFSVRYGQIETGL